MKIKTKNTDLINEISGNLWTLKWIVSGHCDKRLDTVHEGIEHVEKLINKIEI
tara:strand:- start:524 stop:682 length:159 start_codon:yes stop_codon:yes gene_type:complete